MRYEISTERSNGRNRVEGSEPATARGRRQTDRRAEALMAQPGVLRVNVRPVDRVANDEGGAR